MPIAMWGRNIDKGLSDGMKCTGGEPSRFHGTMDGAVAEWEPLRRLSGREVYQIHWWGRNIEGNGYGFYAENTPPH